MLENMKRIETAADMMKWAKAINNNPMSTKDKCDFQDIWAHSQRDTLNKLFMEVNGDRKLVLCGVYNTMSYDEVEILLLHYAQTKGRKIVDDAIEYEMNDVNKLRGELFKKENSLRDCIKGYWKRMRALRLENIELKRREAYRLIENDKYRDQLRELRREMSELREKAEKYDTIKRAIA
jgi:hypothetical protein